MCFTVNQIHLKNVSLWNHQALFAQECKKVRRFSYTIEFLFLYKLHNETSLWQLHCNETPVDIKVIYSKHNQSEEKWLVKF